MDKKITIEVSAEELEALLRWTTRAHYFSHREIFSIGKEDDLEKSRVLMEKLNEAAEGLE